MTVTVLDDSVSLWLVVVVVVVDVLLFFDLLLDGSGDAVRE